MDPEKQPLLSPVRPEPELRQRKFRALTTEEVLNSRQETTWRRTHIFLLFLFWSLMVACLSTITSMLLTASKCKGLDRAMMPSVPPVHMNLASLVYKGREENSESLM